MELTSVYERLAATSDLAAGRAVVRELRGASGLSEGYFQALLTRMGSDPEAAKRLGGHWQTIRDLGDSPAWAYRAKGGADRLEGKWTQSAQAFQKAGSLATDPVDRLSFQAGAVDSLARAGKVDEAVRLGKRLAAGLDKLGARAAAGRVRLNVGGALTFQERFGQARVWLERALVDLEAAGLAYETAACRVSLSTAHLYAGSLARCKQEAATARDALLEMGLDHFAILAEINIGHALLVEGRADEALDLFLAVQRETPEDTPDGARLAEFVATAYHRLNLWQEAEDGFRGALSKARLLPPVNVAQCEFGIAQTLIAQHDLRGGREHLLKAKRRFDRVGNVAWAARSATAIAAVDLAQGRTGHALRRASVACDLARTAGTPDFLVESALVLADASVRKGIAPAEHLHSSRRLIRKHGFVADAWRAEYIAALGSEGTERLRHFRRMFDAMLSGRLLVRSISARTGFLKDKQDALRAFLGELLSRPTPARTKEALNVIRRSRAVALLDEIASDPAAISPELMKGLEALRAEMNALQSGESAGDGARRFVSPPTGVANLQRRWTEATRRLVAQAEWALAEEDSDEDVAVFVEAGQQIHAIVDGRARRLPVSRELLTSRLRWMEFELFSAVGDRNADPTEALAALRTLGEAVIRPWIAESDSRVAISPDGLLWRLPWQACAVAMDLPVEFVMALHPSNRALEGEVTLPAAPRVVLWTSAAPDLPYAGVEIDRLLELFPNAEVCRTVEEARASLASGPVDLLHIAAHAAHCDPNPMFSFVELANGRIFATEVARSPLKVGLATLSACDSGSLSVTTKDEPDGLARAFLARGARFVVGTAWRLDDEAASAMMPELYRSLVNGSHVTEALRHARDAARGLWPHPYYWAPLVLFGGYR